MNKIKVTKAEEWNWYKVGEVHYVKDAHKYEGLGVQVFQDPPGPDVVSHGHYEYTN
ncbi:hypothetical protein [Paenibacillus sp. FSL R7-269]|uniref:hypothetical protein n=1 Tax=Paenibacillus sp. FSL R7-269 TaxID=1226755 RepID=UPI00138E4A4B|nr:hypothetical protein [Paenibacillus sp. FSL R7-269]